MITAQRRRDQGRERREMQREGKSIGSGKKTARQTGADILKTRWE